MAWWSADSFTSSSLTTLMTENKKQPTEYELDDGQLTEEQYTKIRKLASYELDKSTGEVVRLFDD